MNEMIERVALAMQEAAEGPAGDFDVRPHECYVRTARAAIEAMREPTETMIAAFYDVDQPGEPTSATDGWNAMIDAALSDKSK